MLGLLFLSNHDIKLFLILLSSRRLQYVSQKLEIKLKSHRVSGLTQLAFFILTSRSRPADATLFTCSDFLEAMEAHQRLVNENPDVSALSDIFLSLQTSECWQPCSPSLWPWKMALCNTVESKERFKHHLLNLLPFGVFDLSRFASMCLLSEYLSSYLSRTVSNGVSWLERER